MARIAPLAPPYEPLVGARLERMMPPGTPAIGLFRTFARNPAMTDAMHTWGTYELSRHLSLSIRDREIVIDRTCARTRCEYEWGVHVAFFAERVGLTAAQLASLTHGDAADGCWDSGRERLLIRAVDALHDTDDVDQPLWDDLRAELDDAALLDLLALCGWYHAISFLARATRVDLEPFAPRFADIPVGPPPRLPSAAMGFAIDGIHHLTLNVTDLERSKAFYAGVLGFAVDQDFAGEKVRLRIGPYTRLVLVPVLPGTPAGDRFSEWRVGLDHVSLGVTDRAELERLVEVLRAAGVVTRGIQADGLGPGVVCFRDPDNIAWEFFEQP